MANIRLQDSNYEQFVLKSDYADSMTLRQEPDGWDDETVKMTRHKDYHGVFISYTGSLKFYDDAKDYIVTNYELGGINAILRLRRYVLKEKDGEIKFVENYNLIADYSSMKIEGNSVSLNFNSNDLEELVKSHETDTFEIERLKSIDDDDLEVMELHKIELSGRTLSGVGETNARTDVNTVTIGGVDYQEVLVEKEPLANKFDRIGTIIDLQAGEFGERDAQVWFSDSSFGTIDDSKMIVVGTEDPGQIDLDVKITWDLKFLMQGSYNVVTMDVGFFVFKWDGEDGYTHVPEKGETVFTATLDSVGNGFHPFETSGTEEFSLAYDECLMFGFRAGFTNTGLTTKILVESSKLKKEVDSFYEASQDISFAFLHDIGDRVMQIITGEEDRFYSSCLGRTEIGYDEDGEYGLIGALSGFWARAFDPATEKYKSLQISLKDFITSVQACFNLGVSIEEYKLKQRLRIENLDYYYRDEVVVKLERQGTKIVRTIDKDLFFSGTSIGYEHGGNYDAQVGLDEPNTRTETVTPIRKSELKYTQLSKIRSDETGLELVRQKPQAQYQDEDTGQDEHNWFLDLKRGELYGYAQKIWSDRLKEIPSGINYPENYKSMFFTPLRMMLRHGWILRAGMEPYVEETIKYANSEDNTNLKTKAKDDWNLGVDEALTENDDILVSKLSRSRFTPTIIEMNYNIDSELMDWIKGTTPVLINGKIENIPNVYFKFEIINENGVPETGYLLQLTPGSNGKLKFQQANENIL